MTRAYLIRRVLDEMSRHQGVVENRLLLPVSVGDHKPVIARTGLLDRGGNAWQGRLEYAKAIVVYRNDGNRQARLLLRQALVRRQQGREAEALRTLK